MIDKNRDTLSYYGGNSADVRMNHWEYNDFIDQLLDDRLSAQGLMKFKRLHSQMSINALVIPIVSFFPAYLANRWLVGILSVIEVLSIEELLLGGLAFWECRFSILFSCGGVSRGQFLVNYLLT